jgi:hypothetical protein
MYFISHGIGRGGTARPGRAAVTQEDAIVRLYIHIVVAILLSGTSMYVTRTTGHRSLNARGQAR